MRPICKVEGCCNLAKPNGVSKKGIPKFYSSCSPHRKKLKKFGGHSKLGACQSCGFIAINSCQLDIDHIDGNHNNNDVFNLQTLCANCHRLKTWLNKDWT